VDDAGGGGGGRRGRRRRRSPQAALPAGRLLAAAAAAAGAEGHPEAAGPLAVGGGARLVPAEPAEPAAVVAVAAAAAESWRHTSGRRRRLIVVHAAREVEEHELQRLFLAVELADFAFRGEHHVRSASLANRVLVSRCGRRRHVNAGVDHPTALVGLVDRRDEVEVVTCFDVVVGG
jgi:hypothetical protein